MTSAALLTVGILAAPLVGAEPGPGGPGPSHQGILWLNEQHVDVVNHGWAMADSGHNEVVGNASDSSAEGGQIGPQQSATTTVENGSDGSASAGTGAAAASGSNSQTAVAQTHATAVPQTPNDRIVSDQSVSVVNHGSAVATTGGNSAVGNASTSTATGGQMSMSGSSSSVSVTNTSDGTASVTTGSATATGNQSATTVTQG